MLRRHATSLGNLSEEEGLALGRLMPALSRALEQELHVDKDELAVRLRSRLTEEGLVSD